MKPAKHSGRRRTAPGETRERVLDFVRRAIGRGLPPTVREVQQALGFRAVQTAREHLEKLVADGQLAKDGGRARGYRLPDDSPTHLVPLVGRVAAGGLTEALETPDGQLRIELKPHGQRMRAGTQRAQLFALRVQGDSMTGAGILDGDVVIVQRDARTQDGDIVVARVGGEATVKRLRVRRERVELHPENPAYAPIVVPRDDGDGASEEFAVLGRVIEVRRYYPGSTDLASA